MYIKFVCSRANTPTSYMYKMSTHRIREKRKQKKTTKHRQISVDCIYSNTLYYEYSHLAAKIHELYCIIVHTYQVLGNNR